MNPFKPTQATFVKLQREGANIALVLEMARAINEFGVADATEAYSTEILTFATALRSVYPGHYAALEDCWLPICIVAEVLSK